MASFLNSICETVPQIQWQFNDPIQWMEGGIYLQKSPPDIDFAYEPIVQCDNLGSKNTL